MRPCEDGSS